MRIIVALLLVSMCLSGCVLNHVTVVDMTGDKIGFPIGGIIPVSGDDVSGKIVRWFYWTNEEGRDFPPMPEVVARAIVKALEKNER